MQPKHVLKNYWDCSTQCSFPSFATAVGLAADALLIMGRGGWINQDLPGTLELGNKR